MAMDLLHNFVFLANSVNPFMAPGITADAAKFLMDSGTNRIGIATPCINKPPNESHFIVLGNDALIIEGYIPR